MEQLFDILRGASPIEAFLMGIILVYALVSGIIKTPKWLNIGKYKKKDSQSVHESCQYFPDLKVIVIRAIQKSVQMTTIMTKTTIDEQLVEMKDLFADVKDQLKSTYLTLFKEQHNGDIGGLLLEKDVTHYIAILEGAKVSFAERVTIYLEQNGFAEKTEVDFRQYVNKRVLDLQKLLSSYLDENYSSAQFDVSREMLFEYNMQHCMPKMTDRLEEFFYKVREISQRNQELVDKLRDDIGDFYVLPD